MVNHSPPPVGLTSQTLVRSGPLPAATRWPSGLSAMKLNPVGCPKILIVCSWVSRSHKETMPFFAAVASVRPSWLKAILVIGASSGKFNPSSPVFAFHRVTPGSPELPARYSPVGLKAMLEAYSDTSEISRTCSPKSDSQTCIPSPNVMNAIRWLSGLKATVFAPSVVGRMKTGSDISYGIDPPELTLCGTVVSQIRTASGATVAKCWPSGLKTASLTWPSWPVINAISFPVARSQILTCPSKLAEASKRPSGLKVRPLIKLVWPSR